MGTMDEFAVETAMTIALAMVVYSGAQALGLSGAIAVVGAGMMFGGERAKKAMEGATEAYLKGFWHLVDEILNALLFLLLGVELLAVPWWPPTPARPLAPDEDWAPSDWHRLGTELAVAPFGERALLVGRPALRWLRSELVRLHHLAAIAATVAPAYEPQ